MFCFDIPWVIFSLRTPQITRIDDCMNSQVQNELQAEILFYYPPRYLNVANCMQERLTIYISDRQFVLVALYMRGSHKVDE